MKKRGYILLILLFAMLLLVGCNNVADSKQIQSDLGNYSRTDFLSDGEIVKSLEITKRETEKKKNLDVVSCTVTTEDEKCTYEKEMILTYTYDDNNGWVLDYVTVNDSDKWKITPLSGVTEEDISASLEGTIVTADGEKWEITKDNVDSISISGHETDIEGNTDTVTLTLKLDDLVEEATGQLILNYVFEKEWKLDSVSGNEAFAVQVKPGIGLDATEETLMSELSGMEFQYGAPKDGLTYSTSQLQTIVINQNEISNFKIESHEKRSKGTEHRYNCSFTLTKPQAEFTVNAMIYYLYINSKGWVLQPISTTMECASVNIEGEWKGQYNGAPYGGNAVLTITSIAEDGTMAGTYSYTPEVISERSEPGSYEVSGKIDLTTMLLNLTAGEWINKPVHSALMKQDIRARLVVEDSHIEGVGQHSKPFKVTMGDTE